MKFMLAYTLKTATRVSQRFVLMKTPSIESVCVFRYRNTYELTDRGLYGRHRKKNCLEVREHAFLNIAHFFAEDSYWKPEAITAN